MTILQIRLTRPTDYPQLCHWWQFWRFPAPTMDLLDDLRFGIMVHNGTENICCGFIYFTNAKAYAMMEYIVSSHEVRDKTLRREALEYLIISLKELARSKGVKALYSSLKNDSLIKHYHNCGFITGSTNTTEMICKL